MLGEDSHTDKYQFSRVSGQSECFRH